MPERDVKKPFGLAPDPAEWSATLDIMRQLDEQVPYHRIATDLNVEVGAVHQVQEHRAFYEAFREE